MYCNYIQYYVLEPVMDKPYTVALMGWPDVPAAARIAAEVRFATEFERILAGVAGIMAAWVENEEVIESLAGPDDMRLLSTAWARALEGAADAGWRGMPERPARACFRVVTEGD